MDSTCLLMNKRNVLFASIRNSLFDIFHLRYIQEKRIIHYLNYNISNPVAILYILNINKYQKNKMLSYSIICVRSP